MFSFDTIILLVDDATTTRNLLKKYLVELGFKDVRQAPSGDEAWKVLETSNPPVGLVFCDWNMPGMSGLDLLTKVRAEEKFKMLPFILVTSERSAEYVMKAVKAGVSNYIVKPFDKDGLLTKLQATHGTCTAQAAKTKAQPEVK